MAEVSARARRALILIAVLYAGVVVPVGIHKGGDFAAHLLLFLGWVAAVSHPAPLQGRRAWYAALALAGIATSGLVLALSPRALRWQLLNRWARGPRCMIEPLFP